MHERACTVVTLCRMQAVRMCRGALTNSPAKGSNLNDRQGKSKHRHQQELATLRQAVSSMHGNAVKQVPAIMQSRAMHHWVWLFRSLL
jgi:hypothetical protein